MDEWVDKQVGGWVGGWVGEFESFLLSVEEKIHCGFVWGGGKREGGEELYHLDGKGGWVGGWMGGLSLLSCKSESTAALLGKVERGREENSSIT